MSPAPFPVPLVRPLRPPPRSTAAAGAAEAAAAVPSLRAGRTSPGPPRPNPSAMEDVEKKEKKDGLGKKTVGSTVLGRRRLTPKRKRPRSTERGMAGRPSEDAGEVSEDAGAVAEEVTFTGVQGDVFPHLRESCCTFAFPAEARKFCDLCFCFACDVPASQCPMWTAHAEASSQDPDWVRIRRSLQKEREIGAGPAARVVKMEAAQSAAVARHEAARPRKKPKQRPSHPLLRCGCAPCKGMYNALMLGFRIKAEDGDVGLPTVTLDMAYSQRKHAMDVLDKCSGIEYELHGSSSITVSRVS